LTAAAFNYIVPFARSIWSLILPARFSLLTIKKARKSEHKNPAAFSRRNAAFQSEKGTLRIVKRSIPRISPLSLNVCLLLALSSLTGLAQSQNPRTSEKNPPADKTLSSKGAAVITVAPKPDYLSPLELEILEEMNFARMEPQKYAAFVEEFKSYYNGYKLLLPGRQKALVTSEGVAAVDGAIGFLRAAKPLPPFSVTKGMCLAAKDHATDLARKGVTGHKGSDGSSPNARLERYGDWEGLVGENIVYDVLTARQIVIGLIIDDGTSNRGHRRNIFDANHRVAGVSITDSADYGAKCVLNYAGGFRDKGAVPNRTNAPKAEPGRTLAPRKL
jgi:uncharacterized protein YkwD